jgi:tetratricopeptide (TPR) repeat protein
MQATPGASSSPTQTFVSWLNRGIAHQQAGRNEEALTAYREALTCNAHSDFAFACLGDVLNCLGRHEEALVASRCATGLNPACALAYFSESEALINLRRYQEALRSSDQAIALTGSEAAYTVKADILTEMQRYQEALKTYGWALRLNPGHAAIYNNLGLLLIRMRCYEQAQRSFEQAIALKPDEALFASNLGQLLQELGKANEVVGAQADVEAVHVQQANTALFEATGNQTSWEDMETAYMRAPRLFRSVMDRL